MEEVGNMSSISIPFEQFEKIWQVANTRKSIPGFNDEELKEYIADPIKLLALAFADNREIDKRICASVRGHKLDNVLAKDRIITFRRDRGGYAPMFKSFGYFTSRGISRQEFEDKKNACRKERDEYKKSQSGINANFVVFNDIEDGGDFSADLINATITSDHFRDYESTDYHGKWSVGAEINWKKIHEINNYKVTINLTWTEDQAERFAAWVKWRDEQARIPDSNSTMPWKYRNE